MSIYKRLGSGETTGIGSSYAAEMVLPFTLATSETARDNHRLMPGCFVKNWGSSTRNGLSGFLRNPVILDSHQNTTRAVGKAMNVRETPDGKLLGDIKFADTPDGRELFSLYRDGFQNACSVSWIPHEATRAKDRGSDALNFHRVELLETSLVSVPADENALVQGRALSRRSKSPHVDAFDDLLTEVRSESGALMARFLVAEAGGRIGPNHFEIRVSARAALAEFEKRARLRGLSSNRVAQLAAIFRETMRGRLDEN